MKKKDVLVVGLALFAMFFGAGNLIFPTFLGVESCSSWIIGFVGFIIADVGLALLSIVAAAKFNGDINDMFSKVGKIVAITLGCAIMICLGPLLAIPRTAATTFEMGIKPLLPGFNSILFSIIFFAITLVLTIKPSKVVDIIGEFLTPALFATLIFLIIVGIVNPIDSVTAAARIKDVFAEGITQGYQTMDALGALALSTVIMTTLTNKGYTETKDKIKVTFRSAIIAGLGLIIVYGGLAYLGATIANQYADIPLESISQTSLIVAITDSLLGQPGKILLAVIIGLACLTTAIGLTSATAQYFEQVTNKKLKYETIVIIVCVFSAFISNFGVSSIIKFSAPILSMIYPPTVALVTLNLFREKIKNDNVFIYSTFTAFFISVFTVLNDMGLNLSFVNKLPLASLGFNWVVPVLIAAIIGSFVHSKHKDISIG